MTEQAVEIVEPKAKVKRQRVKVAPGTPMWAWYDVKLQFEGPFAASIPRSPKEIRAMLTHRAPTNGPDGDEGLDTLARRVMQEVGVDPDDPETWLPGWATFKRDDTGLYYEGRCIRGHLKECGQQITPWVPVENFLSKWKQAVYVRPEVIYLGRKEVDGNEERFIHVMTAQGPRNSVKYIDYVSSPLLEFSLKVKNDGVITEEHLNLAFEYGGTHGMGQDRGQSWGIYTHTLTKRPDQEPGD